MSEAWRVVRTALAVGLAAGCVWGSLQGLWNVVAARLLTTSALTVALEALRSALDERIALCLTAALAAVLGLAVARAGLRALRHPRRDAALGSTCAGLAMAGAVVALRLLGEAGRLAAIDSLEGVLVRVIIVQAFLLLAVGAWLRFPRRGLDAALQLGRRAGVRWVLAGAVYWLAVHGAFAGANAWATGAAEADRRRPVVLIGVDGATWDVMDPLLRSGALPHIQQLMDAGTWGPLATLEPTLSPVIWTTIATGMPMAEHGITHFVVEGTGSREDRLVTSGMRRVKALWNIAGDQERSVGVVGWMVTWPAEPVNGFLVSSYTGMSRTFKGRLSKGVPEQTWPRDLFQRLEPRMRAVESQVEGVFRRIFPRLDAHRLNEVQRATVADTRDVLFADMLNAGIGIDLLRERRPDLFALYLGGADVSSHRFWKYMEPDALPYDVSGEHVAMLEDVIPNYYRYVDDVVGRVVAACGEDALIVLLSDHGMHAYLSPGVDDDRSSAHHVDAPPGILVVSGRGVRRGPLPVAASVFDIAPTVLHVLGLPLAADMRGRPLLAALRDPGERRPPPRYVASFEDGGAAAPATEATETEFDELLKERLESLGYLR